eukprot:353125-Chlamydomonas_euryale.AAC.4
MPRGQWFPTEQNTYSVAPSGTASDVTLMSAAPRTPMGASSVVAAAAAVPGHLPTAGGSGGSDGVPAPSSPDRSPSSPPSSSPPSSSPSPVSPPPLSDRSYVRTSCSPLVTHCRTSVSAARSITGGYRVGPGSRQNTVRLRGGASSPPPNGSRVTSNTMPWRQWAPPATPQNTTVVSPGGGADTSAVPRAAAGATTVTPGPEMSAGQRSSASRQVRVCK